MAFSEHALKVIRLFTEEVKVDYERPVVRSNENGDPVGFAEASHKVFSLGLDTLVIAGIITHQSTEVFFLGS
jgi:hypothetical protein